MTAGVATLVFLIAFIWGYWSGSADARTTFTIVDRDGKTWPEGENRHDM